MKSRCRGVDRCDLKLSNVPYARYLAQKNEEGRLAEWHRRAAVIAAGRATKVGVPDRSDATQAPKSAESLPRLSDVNTSPTIVEQVRVTVAYQISVPTSRGARIDLLG